VLRTRSCHEEESNSDRGCNDGLVDTTDALGVSALRCDVDVALIAPVFTPRVAHDVVLGALVYTPADSDDSVIEISWAAVVDSDDTAAVVPEHRVSSGNSNTRGLRVESVQVGGSSLPLFVGVHERDTFALIVRTGRFRLCGARRVDVVFFEHSHVGLVPVPGPEVPTAVTAIVFGHW